jgi:hypothetical protein
VARRPPERLPGRYIHDDLVPLAVVRKVCEPAPTVRPRIVAQPWWSTAALWTVGLCFLAVAILLGFAVWNAMP